MKHRVRSAQSVVNPDGHIIGLDIGATAVRAAILSPPRDGGHVMTLADAGQADLPPGTVTDGILTDPATLTSVLTAMWRTYDFGCRSVIVGVSNPQVVVRAMTMPRLPPEQHAKALPYQARDIISLPLDKVLLDFHELGTVESDQDSVFGLLIAVPRDPVIAVVRAVEAAGLRIVRVDLSSFAALRSVAAFGLPAEAIVDIGAQLTTVVIHHHGIPRVIRTLPRGGQALTDRLVERTGVGPVEAELLKCEMGLANQDSEVSMILRQAIRPLVTDIRGSIQYFQTTNEDAVLERVSLTGGGAHLPGLVEMLTEDVGIPCSVVSPLQHIRDETDAPTDLHDEPDPSRSAVSIGLALGAAA